jgi:myosin heavy subunit
MALDVPDTGQQTDHYQTEKDNITKLLTTAQSVIEQVNAYDDATLVEFGRFRLSFFPGGLRELAEKFNGLWNTIANEREKANIDLQNARKQYADEHQAHGIIAAELEKCKSNLELLDETYAAEVKGHHKKRDELQEVNGELQEAKNKLQEAENKLQEAENKLQEAENKLQEAENKLQEAENKLQEVEGEIHKTQPALRQCTANLAALEKSFLDEQQAHDETKAELQHVKDELEEVRRKQPALEQCRVDLAAERMAHDTTRNSTVRANSNLRLLNQQGAELRKSVAQVRQLETAASEDRKTIRDLRDDNGKLYVDNEKLRALIQQKDNAYAELEKANTAIDAECKQKLQAQDEAFATERAGIVDKHGAQYDELHAIASRKIDRRDERLKQLSEEHQKAISAKDNAHAAKVDQMSQELEAKKAEFTSELNRLSEAHGKALASKDTEHAEELNRLSQDHGKALAAIDTEAKNQAAAHQVALATKDAEHANTLRSKDIEFAKVSRLKKLSIVRKMFEDVGGIVKVKEDDIAKLWSRHQRDRQKLREARVEANELARACDLLEAEKQAQDKNLILQGHEENFTLVMPAMQEMVKCLSKGYSDIVEKRVQLQKQTDHLELDQKVQERTRDLQQQITDLRTTVRALEAIRTTKRPMEENFLDHSPKRQRVTAPSGPSQLTPVMEGDAEVSEVGGIALDGPPRVRPGNTADRDNSLPDICDDLLFDLESQQGETSEEVNGNMLDGGGHRAVAQANANGDDGSHEEKAATLRSMFYPAWDISDDDEARIVSAFSTHFSKGRTLASVVEDIDRYCTTNKPNSVKPWPPPCLDARIQHTAAGTSSMTQKTCPFCKKKNKICLFAKFAPGLEGNNTVSIAGKDVRWILKKRRESAQDALDQEWKVGELAL